MARVVRRRWVGDVTSGLPRRDRQSCEYEAYVPDLLEGRVFTLEGPVAADVAEAEAAVARLNAGSVVLADTEALARLMLRAEAVASSRIEGLEVGGRRLLRAEAARVMGESPADVTAEEVLGNIDAMAWAVTAMAHAPEVRVGGILEMHRRLFAGSRLVGHGGRLREEQNWIGGSGYNPCSASFVPPPPEEVRDLLEDLCRFCNGDSLPVVALAAVAHAQFETIHPFGDGNGRTGRALVHVVLRRGGLAPRVVPPVSLILATWARDYVAGLTATRYRGRATSSAAHDGVNQWIGFFAAACRRAVRDAARFEERVREIQQQWKAALGPVRAGSATALLCAVLPGAPILTTTIAAELLGRSFQATNEAIARLEAAGVLNQITVGRRNRAFEARAVIDVFTDFERQLASPGGDTRVATRPTQPPPPPPTGLTSSLGPPVLP